MCRSYNYFIYGVKTNKQSFIYLFIYLFFGELWMPCYVYFLQAGDLHVKWHIDCKYLGRPTTDKKSKIFPINIFEDQLVICIYIIQYEYVKENISNKFLLRPTSNMQGWELAL